MTAKRDKNEFRKPAMRMMDGHIHTPEAPSLAHGLSLDGSGLIANQMSNARRAILFLDELRLTRDCLTETIQDHCPEMQVIGLRPDDFDSDAIRPDIALIIFNLHDAPIEAAAASLQPTDAQASPPLLLITMRDERSAALQAVAHDVAGLVRADTPVELLIAAIRLVIAGGRYFPADILTMLMAKAPPARHGL